MICFYSIKTFQSFMKILAKFSIMTRNMLGFCTGEQRAQWLTGKLKPEVVGLSPCRLGIPTWGFYVGSACRT